ncbi:hypothetical protein BIV23_01855 [Streptomyces monashensis]|uniref:MFS transporter n=1 Tax=Streptomyces monashensis TaxID=1678012 RepID=A0A1S2QP81_9ACTN|nr:hypothetical protein BIV23_01855 [Streptomyces monashensis]
MFAVLCVLLAAGGHAMATGMAPSVWVQVAGFVPVFAAGSLLAGRERSSTAIGAGTLAAQGGLHLVFHAAEPRHAAMVMHGMRMVQAPHAPAPHATAAHAGAALLLTWWLRRGEVALWSLLRWAVAFVPGLAAWWQVTGGTRRAPAGPGLVRRAAGEPWAPGQVRLRYTVHRRGPPTGMSYAQSYAI